MARYELVVKRSVSKDLRSIPNKDVTRILQRMEMLRENPRPTGCEKLSGGELYRIRQGRYRIVYEIIDGCLVVIIIRVGHRKHIYKTSRPG